MGSWPKVVALEEGGVKGDTGLTATSGYTSEIEVWFFVVVVVGRPLIINH